jgi:hypothetical protein
MNLLSGHAGIVRVFPSHALPVPRIRTQMGCTDCKTLLRITEFKALALSLCHTKTSVSLRGKEIQFVYPSDEEVVRGTRVAKLPR